MIKLCDEALGDQVLQEDLEDIARSSTSIEKWRNSTVLVTGATGLVGSQLVKALACIDRVHQTNMQILAHVRNREKAEQVFGSLLQRSNISLVEGDITTPLNVQEKIDYIFHTASVTTSKFFVNNPVETLAIAIDGTRNVLELAKAKEVKGLVYLSSMEAFGITDPALPLIKEKDLGYIDILSVRSSYSEGKRICECLCAAYAAEYGVPVKIARLAQTFGSGVSEEDNRAFAQFAKSALAGNDIVLHTAGTSVGNYCYTADAIKGLFAILFKGVSGEAYTVTNETTAMQIKEVAQLVADTLSGGKTKICFDIPESALTYGYAPDVTMRLSAEKLRQLGWAPSVDLPEMFLRLAKSWGKSF